ncbi:MAG: FAD-dependent oxidoreductase, partial [Acidobacteriota bacterium]
MNAKQKTVEVEYLVVGAGIAGLGAATYLHEQGKEVLVLESERHPGGRMWTNSKGDTPYDIGAQFIDSSYKNIIRYSKRYGLQPVRVPIPRTGISDGHTTHMLATSSAGILRFKGMKPRARVGFLASAVKVVASRPHINSYNLKTGLPLDSISAEKYFLERTNKQGVTELLSPIIHGLAFYSLKETSAAFLKAFIGKLLLLKPLTYSRGIGELPATLAEKLDVIYGAKIMSIERQKD